MYDGRYSHFVPIPTLRRINSGSVLCKVRIPTSPVKVRIFNLRWTIPELYRFLLCAEHVYLIRYISLPHSSHIRLTRRIRGWSLCNTLRTRSSIPQLPQMLRETGPSKKSITAVIHRGTNRGLRCLISLKKAYQCRHKSQLPQRCCRSDIYVYILFRYIFSPSLLTSSRSHTTEGGVYATH